jgi:hypothetical protein
MYVAPLGAERGDPWLILGSFVLFIVNKGVAT